MSENKKYLIDEQKMQMFYRRSEMYDQTGLIREYISSEVKFYTVADIMRLTGWRESIVLKMFFEKGIPTLS